MANVKKVLSGLPLKDITNSNQKGLKQAETKAETKAASKSTLHYEEIDNCLDFDVYDEDNDPQRVSEYVDEIYSHLFETENRNMIHKNFLQAQPEIDADMRMILFDWLVGTNFNWSSETLFLSLNLVDRYTEKVLISKTNYQLVGMVALHLASKFEDLTQEIVTIDELIRASDYAFDREKFLDMEEDMFSKLNFYIVNTTPIVFLRRLTTLTDSEKLEIDLSKMIIECSYYDPSMNEHTPSLIAAGSFYLARKMLERTQLWSKKLADISRVTKYEAKVMASKLNGWLYFLRDSPFFANTPKKYSFESNSCVSIKVRLLSEAIIDEKINKK